ncbi:class I SAM-dependent methyltransferase [Clostridium sp.]|uniref:class I SAM-dependent methyltransferase n=1 Tax=Clostridium sp. TaxID=1506 RepID=UPI002FDEE58F
MTHKFDAKNKHKLDNATRRKLLPPEETLIKLGLQQGDTVADIGCGIGYFSIPACEIVGERGKIFAIDILPEMLQEVEINKKKHNLVCNIETILTTENSLKLEDNTISFALISNVLHEASDREKLLSEIKRILSYRGRLAIVEWEKIQGEFGPPLKHRLDKFYLIEVLEKIKFSNISFVNIGENFYGLTAQK